MPDETQEDEPIFRIISVEKPTSTVVLAGPSDEPLVVEQTWPGGKVEKKRVVNSERSFQVPAFVFWDETVTPDQQSLIQEAVGELYDQIGFDKTKLHFFGNWKEDGHRDLNGLLIPHKSTQWQVESKWNASRSQVKADGVAYEMFQDPFQVTNPHWEVIFTNKDLYITKTSFVIGVAQPDLGTLVSLKRLEAIRDEKLRRETQKTEIYHEVGHIFGLPSGRRGDSKLEYSLGAHCKSPGCSMKQGMQVPTDWVNFTTERLKAGGNPFCEECITDLKVKFHRKHE